MNFKTTNRNPATGIPYGIIKADAIDPDLWHELCYTHGKDIHYDEALAAHLKEKKAEHEESGSDEEFDEDFETESFGEDYEQSEPIYAGQHEGVHYQTTWLGGAPLLWVFESPVVTHCGVCSPCVPGAGDLDNHGEYLAYGVPASWLTTDFMKDRCEDAGFEFSDGPDHYWRNAENDSDNGGPFPKYDLAVEDCYMQRLQQLPGDSDATK